MATGAIYLTQASAGAPNLTGQNNSLCAVLDWALPQKDWAIEYTATNARVYRPGSGNRRRLFVAHGSAVSGDSRVAVIRGAEDASAATIAGLSGPFPTVAQVDNTLANIKLSTTNNSDARPFRIVLSDTFLLFAASTNSSSVADWDFFFFGDLAGVEPGDTWATAIHVASAPLYSSGSSRSMVSCMSTVMPSSANRTFLCRNRDGSVSSSVACLGGSTNGNPGSLMAAQNTPVMRAGYANRIIRERVCVRDFGGSSVGVGGLQVFQRGWLPNFWNPVHSGIGTVTSDDTHTDSAYAVGSKFVLIPATSTVAFLMEVSDTWSPPNG